MLTRAYLVAAIVIGFVFAAAALADRREFPSQLPPFHQDQVSQDPAANMGKNLLRDERTFSERLGNIRFITSIYHLVNKRH